MADVFAVAAFRLKFSPAAIGMHCAILPVEGMVPGRIVPGTLPHRRG